MLEAPVEHGTERYAIRFDASALDVPMRGHDPMLHAVLERFARRLGEALPDRSDIRALVRHAVSRDLTRPPTIGEVAKSLGLSTRVLQKRLRKAGVTYRGLVDEVRMAFARALLTRGASTKRVAGALGYSDTRAFHRAFLRVAGMTPAQYRKRHAADS